MTHPAVVTACNLDLESLISDVNRSIATLAITTLLKTGAESSVDRLMKQISSFVNEISDEFKIVVVQVRRRSQVWVGLCPYELWWQHVYIRVYEEGNWLWY